MLAHGGMQTSFYIDSTMRDAGTTSDFTVQIPDLVSYDSCVLKSAAIPKAWYFLRAPYLSFWVGSVVGEFAIQMDVGNYTLNCFTHCLTQKLGVFGITMTFPSGTQPQTGKFSFAAPASIRYFRFAGPGISHGCGFDLNSTNYFNDGKLTSRNCIILNSNPCVYLCSDIIDGTTEVLQELLGAGVPDFEYLTYTWSGSVELSSKRVKRVNTDRARFWVSDTAGHPLDLNGLPIHLELCLYKRSNLSELQHTSLLIDQAEKLGT